MQKQMVVLPNFVSNSSVKLNVVKRGEGELGFSQQLYMCLFKQAVLSFLLLRISEETKSSLEIDKQQ